jgi:hypothetical protein
VAQYAVPDFHMASRIVASFRLTATIAFFIEVRLAIRNPHAFSGVNRPRFAGGWFV